MLYSAICGSANVMSYQACSQGSDFGCDVVSIAPELYSAFSVCKPLRQIYIVSDI